MPDATRRFHSEQSVRASPTAGVKSRPAFPQRAGLSLWIASLLGLMVLLGPLRANPAVPAELTTYREQLIQLRKEFGGAKQMPDVSFFLFGMGNRTKMVYSKGVLRECLSSRPLHRWAVSTESIVPPAYRVELQTTSGGRITINEDEDGVWIAENGHRIRAAGTEEKLVLPGFSGFKYGDVLRVLNQEILINILRGKPLPNFLVYTNPWRRDAAMMAMCLEKTGNLGLIRDWVLGLEDPYDHNNKMGGIAENEADNLGQTLYLISRFANRDHPAVKRVLSEIPRFYTEDAQGKYIRGRSDFHETPVYQTKWLKFGLKSLGLDDPYSVPKIADDYASLFWWDYREEHSGTESKADDYPYLGWARDHYFRKKRSPISDRDYPLTWEINASQADYARMEVIDPRFASERNSMPHSWHAAEVFLYLLEFRN